MPCDFAWRKAPDRGRGQPLPPINPSSSLWRSLTWIRKMHGIPTWSPHRQPWNAHTQESEGNSRDNKLKFFHIFYKNLLTNEFGCGIISNVRGSGGIGRRARLRGVYLWCTGSSPVSRTNKKADQMVCLFFERKRDRPQDRLLVFKLKTIINRFLNAWHFPHQVKTRMKILVFIFWTPDQDPVSRIEEYNRVGNCSHPDFCVYVF